MGPLKIAFFGSDAFSVLLLARLTAYARSNPSKVSRIDVITRSIKPTGRKLNTFVDLPIGTFSSQNGINVFRADSKDDILAIPNEFDLAVAVSYGRLIPSQFLQSCVYGGVNVHPSLLPQYSGSSPIQYALMNDDKFTGVTVQTLHPTKFDHGDILIQSSQIPINQNDTYSTLVPKLGEIGADLLVESIHSELFIRKEPLPAYYPFSLAPKIDPLKRNIDWTKMSCRLIKRRQDALGSVYTCIPVTLTRKGKTIRDTYKVFLEDISTTDKPYDMPVGSFCVDNGKLIVRTIDGAIEASTVKLQTYGSETPQSFVNSLKKKTGSTETQFVNEK